MYMADVRVGERMGVVIGFMTRRAEALSILSCLWSATNLGGRCRLSNEFEVSVCRKARSETPLSVYGNVSSKL